MHSCLIITIIIDWGTRLPNGLAGGTGSTLHQRQWSHPRHCQTPGHCAHSCPGHAWCFVCTQKNRVKPTTFAHAPLLASHATCSTSSAAPPTTGWLATALRCCLPTTRRLGMWGATWRTTLLRCLPTAPLCNALADGFVVVRLLSGNVYPYLEHASQCGMALHATPGLGIESRGHECRTKAAHQRA